MSQPVLEQFKKRAEDAAPLEGTLKFVVDGSAIYIDGTSGSNTVTLDDKEADCSITVTAEVLEQLTRWRAQPDDGSDER